MSAWSSCSYFRFLAIIKSDSSWCKVWFSEDLLLLLLLCLVYTKYIYYYLARSANLPTRLYILLALISFSLFFKYEQSYLSIYWTDFHDLFQQMKGICVNFLDPDQFFWFLKGCCHGNQFCVVVDLFAQRPVSQDPLNRFSQTLHHMVDIELRMINPTFLPHILKDVAMETNLVAKIGQNYWSLCHSEK